MRKLFVLIFFIFAAGFFWSFNPKAPQLALVTKAQNQLTELMTPRVKKEGVKAPLTGVQVILKEEAQNLSRLHEDPTSIELGLRERALQLTKAQLLELKDFSLDSRHDQDQRFLAVTLLAWSNQAEAAPHLEAIASSEYDAILNPDRLGDFEKVLRLRATEGLGEISIPNELRSQLAQHILAKSPYPVIADRTHRLLWSQQGLAPKPEEQDLEALGKMIQKK